MDIGTDDKTVTIRINGKSIETTIDEDGAQRLPRHPVIRYLMYHAEIGFNELAELASIGIISEDDWRFIYQNIGYTVSGYAEVLSDDNIENPLWDEK